MGYSVSISPRTPAQQNGMNTLRLQVILNRKPLLLPLGIAWPVELFDHEAGQCLAKLPAKQQAANYREVLQRLKVVVGEEAQQRADDYNLIIGKALAKANEIFIKYRLDDSRVLTVEEFQREYASGASRGDFLTYMEARIAERAKRSQISEGTRIKHITTLNKLREFALTLAWNKACLKNPALLPTLPFHAFTHKFAGDFDSWLKKVHGSNTNTRSGRHRNVKAYLELARRDKVTFDDPYAYFVNTTVKGQWKALSPEELALLEAYYQRTAPGTTHRRMLQKFLFSCHCGLRLGDLKKIDQARIEGQQMELKIQKTYRYDEKATQLPITRKALSYLQDSRRENECDGFFLYTDQYTNRTLQDIAGVLGITTHIHHHIGRETFATNFIRRGGKVEVLQKLMGHKKLSMTMKYVHVDEQMKQDEIDRLDRLDEQDDAPLMQVS